MIYVYTYTYTLYVARYCQYWLLSELLVIKNNIKTIENKIESIMPIEWIEYLSICQISFQPLITHDLTQKD